MIDPLYGPQDAKGVWVHLEHEDGVLESVSLEILGRARELADECHQPVTAVLLGASNQALACEAISLGADEVLVATDPLLSPYTTNPHAKVMSGLVAERRPDILLLAATPDGRDLAGRLAVRLRTGLTADCTDLRINESNGLLVGEVTGFGQGILATIECPEHRPQMATVRPGVFTRPEPDASRNGAIEKVAVSLSEADAPVRVRRRSLRRGVDITQAERLVVAGRGLGGDLSAVKRLAHLLHAEVGGTRVAADEGWISHERMIGQTGSITHPKLAVICGVSGAFQFTVGIQDADTVIAINSDADAPIFDVADYCVVDDVSRILPMLIAGLEKEENGGGG
ncbi:MAG: electron transfer flavoprotein subunit alpha/FixB family protein [Dehalococcoidia bacterium]